MNIFVWKWSKIAAQKKVFFLLILPYKTWWKTHLWHRCYYPHRSRDALSPVCGIFLLTFHCWSPKKVLPKSWKQKKKKKKVLSSHGNIRRAQFDQSSPQPLEEGCHRHTDRHPDREIDMAPLWLNQPNWADSVKII